MITSQRPETALMARGICVLLLAIAGCGQTSQPGGAAQKGAEASATFDQLAAQGVEDPVTSLMTTLRQDPTVSDVTLSPDAATIVVTLQSGDIFNVLTDQADRPEWQEVLVTTAKTAGQVTQQAFDPEQEIICDTTTYPQSKQALLILNFRADLHDRGEIISSFLRRAGYEVQPALTLKSVADIAQLDSRLPGAGVVYFSSHGDVSAADDKHLGNGIATEIEVTESVQTQLFNLYGTERSKFFGIYSSHGKSYIAIMPEFFAQHEYPNSMFYVDSCNSGRSVPNGTQLKDVLTAHGAGAFFGWETSVPFELSNPVSENIFRALAPIQPQTITGVTISFDQTPKAREPYTPSAQITPASSDIEVRLSIRGTDGFRRSEIAMTDDSGIAKFSSVPGGASGVEDTITVVAGGANNTATVLGQVTTPFDKFYKLPWQHDVATATGLHLTAAVQGFNLICNNLNASQTQTVVKF